MRSPKMWSAASLVCAVLLFLTACGSGSDRVPRISGPDSPLPNASIGTQFSATFTATGARIMWSVSNGSLPPGLSLDPNSGMYSGTPTTIGSYTFTVAATNDVGMDTRTYTQIVGLPISDTSALLTGNMLSAFPATYPAGFEMPVAITGVSATDTLVSIDRRPQNGFLYGLGYNATAGTVQLYSISATTALATPIGTTGTFVGPDGVTAVRIGTDDTTVFGMDFNPAVDRVRVVNSAGQNFRINPNTGAFIDGDTTAAGPGINMDGGINGATMTLQETAYANSIQNATVTTQYGLDTVIDSLCIQNPPNAGTQTACQPLSAPLEAVMGFDIPPSVTVTAANAVATGLGTAIVRVAGQTMDELVMVNLTNGSITTRGPIGTSGIVGIAIQQPAATPLVALSADGTQLARFSSATPGTATTVNISGVIAGETLVGIDYRPQTGQLYALGVSDTANNGTVYLLDPQMGTTVIVGGTASQVSYLDASGVQVDLPPASAGYGFDFNPTVDRIRVVTGTGLNFRINPITGLPVDGNATAAGINTDGALNGLPTGSTGATAAAYTNSFGQPTGGATTQYVIDSVSNQLFIQNPPNAGTVTMGMPVMVGNSTLDFSEANGFDIPAQVTVQTSGTMANGLGFAALTVGTTTRLYQIDLSTGRATSLGTLSLNVSGLAAGQTTLH